MSRSVDESVDPRFIAGKVDYGFGVEGLLARTDFVGDIVAIDR